jgi:nuclear GTP-binding protein
VPPTIHPSLVPSTVSASTSAKYNLGASADEPTVAPGAENVGEAKIVTEFAPAFDLGGLFSQADKGAFGDYDMEGGGGEEEQEYMEEDG